jgi:tetratricopeptide (TPR) repeat protein
MVEPTPQRSTSRLVPRFSDRVARLRPIALVVLMAPLALGWAAARAEDLEDAEKLLLTGKYDECAKLAAEEIESNFWGERWAHLKLEADLARGRYAEALRTLEAAERRFPGSVSLHLLGRQVYRFNNRDEAAANEMNALSRLIMAAPERYATPEGRLVLGRFFLLRGADARKVLDQFYDVVTRQNPDFPDAYYATAELALEKQDNALAATTLRKAPRDAADDPRYHYLLARAFSDDDRVQSEKELAEALKINPRHVDSLLLQVDHQIDSERYAEADAGLKRIFEINPHEPRAWCYKAVLAHLRNDPQAEEAGRKEALSSWKKNPEVDHLIGLKLSQKYRFAEGSACQKRALEIDDEYLPARLQLCQDLLRLGEETEGWKLADQVFAKDGYNVVAYNLVTLRDRLAGFRTLEADGFLVRMDRREADLYGDRVLALLGRAKKTLCEKYGITLKDPVIVEIFPQRKEFAVRTFGLPGADGLLGVCFGRVVTANSPASQGEDPANWEAVLWHEFCHVVTLNKTRNKMPRWLSEGISVFEEGQEDPTWSDSLNPRFREMILGEGLTPLSKLSSAFLGARSPLHLQFAYFESALAVEFLRERFGAPALNGLLDDLGAGKSLNEALPIRTKTSLEQLDRDFRQFARKRAGAIAPQATWEEPELPEDAGSQAVAGWLEKHPRSFWGLQRLAVRLVAEEKWPQAIEVLERLKALYPEYVGRENAYVLLATVHKRRSDAAAERTVLEELASRDGDSSAAYLRLIELAEAAGDWKAVERNARRLLAVNPLIPAPHRALARAAERLNRPGDAVAAYRTLVLLDETDPADVHYRLAGLLRQAGKPAEARREVLKALEEAPRFREALRLLLELTKGEPSTTSRPPTSTSTPTRVR